MKIVIPMAGFGKRLRPLTFTRPKPLLTVADKPVLGHVLEMFATLPSIDEVIFIVGHLGDRSSYLCLREGALPSPTRDCRHASSSRPSLLASHMLSGWRVRGLKGRW